jgi:hypothetical protein
MHQDMADIELLIKHSYPNLDLAILKEYFGLFERAKQLNEILERIKNAE